MDRKNAIKTIDKVICNVMAPGLGTDMLSALEISRKSLLLWGDFIERLAEKCNGAVSQEEWMVYRKAIELIKSEFNEEIK